MIQVEASFALNFIKEHLIDKLAKSSLLEHICSTSGLTYNMHIFLTKGEATVSNPVTAYKLKPLES